MAGAEVVAGVAVDVGVVVGVIVAVEAGAKAEESHVVKNSTSLAVYFRDGIAIRYILPEG